MTSTPLLRDLLASTALDLGPQAPTLCDPWRVRDLMAHLVVRESRPDVLPGIGLDGGPLRRHTDQVQDRVAGRRDLPQLAEAVRRGPARWWPTSVGAVDDLVNVPELAVHLEDMVRAQPDWEPTRLPEEVQRALWTSLRRSGRMLYGRAPVGVVVVAEGHGRASLRRPPGRAGTVVLRGTPLELTLHAFGRDAVARVEATGEDADLAALDRHHRSV
ncbi:TIGR03085 family metal-binding protein [uncultured Ornithinimicrobium sp.]|uniref:TIGR03085 family metal-binding protein n=1 Tax=uncultured Ornithinimicrobium sp. TaxID=259307 RepID=UPI002597FB92|nr:TIGR03085 family metal-binding protein [uncultured Ornithinimicrobium sp.]